MSLVTTHVLDTGRGRPAAGVPVSLRRDGTVLAEAVTDDDGRVGELGPDALEHGTYELVFDVAAYAGAEAFFPQVTIAFTVADERHHHVPLLLSPFAYSTYRGS
ncbi:hydroxyisourate hydrolase [Nocardioides sp. MAHUQ-72]|uniref:hydroxyisourate hydrolase n=1 Tax=unclassified Nocardioides TaxID=2615069 RepID=UPI00360907B5